VTLSNTGNLLLSISTISAAGDFAQTNNCGTGIAAGTSCTIRVTFTPTANGTRTGHLSVNDNAPDSPQTVALTGSGPDFTLAPHSGSSSTASVSAGQSVTYTLSLAGVGGFNQSVTLSCTGAPSEATCTVSPTSATAGSSPSSVTVTVSTTASSSVAPRSHPVAPVPPKSPGISGLLMLALVLAAMAWGIVRTNWPSRTRMPPAWVLLAAGLLLVLALAGCGSGSGGGPITPTNPGTPSGTYTLTVEGAAGSGSSALTHTVALTLTVN
jgi:hypothetical protein